MRSAATQLRLFADTEEPGARPGFSVRESKRAKRLAIKVFPRGRVEVVVPKRTRPADVQAFIEANREWIERSRASFARELPPEPFVLPNRIDLPAIEQSFRVRYERRSGAASVSYRNNGGVVTLRGLTGDDAQCIAALRRWLASVAKKEFLPRLQALSELTDNPFRRMHEPLAAILAAGRPLRARLQAPRQGARGVLEEHPGLARNLLKSVR